MADRSVPEVGAMGSVLRQAFGTRDTAQPVLRSDLARCMHRLDHID